MAISWIASGYGFVAIGGFLAAAYFASPPKTIAPPLPAFNVSADQVTLAGTSSGGFMAVQAAIAYSGTFRGVAVFGGGPYYCSEGQLRVALNCYGEKTDGIATQKLIDLTERWGKEDRIDSVAHIAHQKAYLFSGSVDHVVPRDVMISLHDYYEHFTAPGNIVFNTTTHAGHGWISPYGSNPCINEKANYINSCDFDPEKDFLSLFYGELHAKKEGTLSGKIIEFDQNALFDDRDADAHSADQKGFAFVPATCSDLQPCKLVIALHSCGQDYGKVGMDFVMQSGINQWADTNNIIVAYPQIKSTNFMMNPHGCWDWVGYDGKDFAWRSGTQVKMLKRIADRITAGSKSRVGRQSAGVVE